MSIEKFGKGSLTISHGGFTTVINETIVEITDVTALGIYIYLVTKPPGWEVNVKHIMNHFGIGRQKAYAALKKRNGS